LYNGSMALVSRSRRHQLIGQLIDGKYRIESIIGTGGMSTVYRATIEGQKKDVAIKILELEGTENERLDLKNRFKLEAKTTMGINHINVVETLGFGEVDRFMYLAMEKLEGTVLAELVGRGRRLDWDRLQPIAIQIAQGLFAAHQKGIIHRDVKPANIFLVSGGRVKIIDFGVAKVQGSKGQTQAGVVLGTVSYMAPEQIRGQELDFRTDIYALGCVIFEAMTGFPPFVGEDQMDTIKRHLQCAIPRITEMSPDFSHRVELDRMVTRMLAKERQQRFDNMSDVVRELQSLQSPDSDVPVRLERNRQTRAFTGERKPPADHRELVLTIFLYIELAHLHEENLCRPKLEVVRDVVISWMPAIEKPKLSRAFRRTIGLHRECKAAAGSTDEILHAAASALCAMLNDEQRKTLRSGMWRVAGADANASGRAVLEKRRIVKSVGETLINDRPATDPTTQLTDKLTDRLTERFLGGLDDPGTQVLTEDTELLMVILGDNSGPGHW
jgi:serine/threonine protein kinase